MQPISYHMLSKKENIQYSSILLANIWYLIHWLVTRNETWTKNVFFLSFLLNDNDPSYDNYPSKGKYPSWGNYPRIMGKIAGYRVKKKSVPFHTLPLKVFRVFPCPRTRVQNLPTSGFNDHFSTSCLKKIKTIWSLSQNLKVTLNLDKC